VQHEHAAEDPSYSENEMNSYQSLPSCPKYTTTEILSGPSSDLFPLRGGPEPAQIALPAQKNAESWHNTAGCVGYACQRKVLSLDQFGGETRTETGPGNAKKMEQSF
jgi:hypothetical protein